MIRSRPLCFQSGPRCCLASSSESMTISLQLAATLCWRSKLSTESASCCGLICRYARFLNPQRCELSPSASRRLAAPSWAIRLAKQKTPAESYPLSFGQEQIWFAERISPGSSLYNVPGVVELRGPVSAEALARAVSGGFRRHEALHTVIGDCDGVPFQRPVWDVPFSMPTIECDTTERADQITAEELGRPFDLGSGILLRATLLRLSADYHILVICAHHLAVDGWSMRVLVEEIAKEYAAIVGGKSSKIANPTLQMADFAAWQRNLVATVPIF